MPTLATSAIIMTIFTAITFSPTVKLEMPSVLAGQSDPTTWTVPHVEGNVSLQSWRGFYQCNTNEQKTVQQAYSDASSLAKEAHNWVLGGLWDTAGRLYLGDDCGNDNANITKTRLLSESHFINARHI